MSRLAWTRAAGRLRLAAIAAGGTILAATLVAAAGGGTAGAQATGGGCPASIGGLSLTTATIPQLRFALDDGQISSRALVHAYLRRIHAVNRRGPKLRPVIRTNPDAITEAEAADAALGQGRSFGPLTGIPVLIKDNIDTNDLQTTAGARAMLGTPPPRNAFLVARLRQAGAIVLGKTNLDEWATRISDTAPHGFSNVGGHTLNPYTRGEPSGSSGGSAVAAASGLAASTVGTETSGSIIDPAWVNSAVGIKPTRGLVSRGGVVPLLSEYDTPGPIDQNVTDAATMLGLMTGVDPRDPVTRNQIGHAHADYTQFLDPTALEGARIGIPKIPNTRRHRDLIGIVGLNSIRRTLEAQGATVVQLKDRLLVDSFDPNDFLAQFRKQLDRYLRARGPTSPRHSLAEIVAYNRRHGKSAVRYGQTVLVNASDQPPKVLRHSRAGILAARKRARDAMHEAFARNDLDAILVSRGVSALTNTPAGYPAVTVPAGYKKGVPYGAIFAGRPWHEPKLIGYAYDFEQATDAWRSPARFDSRFAAACPA
jgi:amidase